MKPTSDLQEFSSRHRLLLHDVVLNGLTNNEASAKHGFIPEYISTIKNTGLWKREEKKLQNELLSGHKLELAKRIPSAIETLTEVMGRSYEVVTGQDIDTGQDIIRTVVVPPSTRANAAAAILDRSGMGIRSSDDEPRSVVINMFKPPWEGGSGETVTIEVGDNG